MQVLAWQDAAELTLGLDFDLNVLNRRVHSGGSCGDGLISRASLVTRELREPG